jgi:hypothetical protein
MGLWRLGVLVNLHIPLPPKNALNKNDHGKKKSEIDRVA